MTFALARMKQGWVKLPVPQRRGASYTRDHCHCHCHTLTVNEITLLLKDVPEEKNYQISIPEYVTV